MTTLTHSPTLGSATMELAPIDLESLNTAAALQSRIDRKYVLSHRDAEQFVTALSRETAVRCLEINGLRGFNYRSEYADTGELDAYWASVRRSRFRFKVRTRHYLDSDDQWLEVKVRSARGTTDMHRLRTEGRLDPLASQFIEDVLLAYGLPDAAPVAQSLRPVIANQYQRTTLFLPDSQSRLTIDSDLRWTRPGAGHGGPADGWRLPAVVIETKTPSRRSPVDSLLASLGHRPVRISKYATGMALTNPGLPANPWHRLLNRNGVLPQ